MRRRLLFTAATAGIASALLPSTALAEHLDQGLNVDLADWHERVAALGRDHMRLGAPAMRPKLFNELTLLGEANRSGQLNHHIAKVAVLAARSQTSPDDTQTLYTQAQRYADLSGDADTIAWVNGRIALGLVDNPSTAHRHHGYAALALAQDGATGPVGALGVYLAYYAQARAAAVLGEADPALAYLEQARGAYDAIDPDADGTEWSYSAARFCTDNSYVLAAVGRAPAAEDWADQARTAGLQGRFITHLALHPLVGRHRAGDTAAADEARALMAAVAPAQQSLTLRHVAAQAGAREYRTAA